MRAMVRGDWGALGYSTTSVERASGQHNRKLLVIGEEASAIEDAIYDAVDGLKFHRLFLVCNPTRSTGRVVDLIHQAEKDKRDGVPKHLAVNAIRISSRESPDANEVESKVGLADKTFIQDIEAQTWQDIPLRPSPHRCRDPLSRRRVSHPRSLARLGRIAASTHHPGRAPDREDSPDCC